MKVLVVLVDRAIGLEALEAIELADAGQRGQHQVVAQIPVQPQRRRPVVVVSGRRHAGVEQTIAEVFGIPVHVQLSRQVIRRTAVCVHTRAPVGGSVVLGRNGIVFDQGVQRIDGIQRGRAERLRPVRIALIPPGVQRQQRREAVGRIPLQRKPAIEEVFFTGFLVNVVGTAVGNPDRVWAKALAVGVGFHMAIGGDGPAGQAVAQGFADGAAEEACNVQLVETAVLKIDSRLEFLGRLVGDEVNGSPGGVLTKQRPLGSLQRLDTLQIQNGPDSHRCEGDRHLVYADADGIG